MATQCLINFLEFSESKEILKIGRSEVCIKGGRGGRGVLKVGLLNCPYLYSYITMQTKIVDVNLEWASYFPTSLQ